MSDRRAPDDAHLPADATEEERREAGDRLRERIYVTFTALAILMALNAHGEHLDSPTVLWTLIVSVVGVLLAGLASDLVSHMIVHNTLPTAREFRHMLAVASPSSSCRCWRSPPRCSAGCRRGPPSSSRSRPSSRRSR